MRVHDRIFQKLRHFWQGKWLLENRPRLRERSWIFSSETATAFVSVSVFRSAPLSIIPSESAQIQGAERAHKNKSHKISGNPVDGRVSLGHPAGVPAKMPFSVITSNRKSLEHRLVDPCLSRWVSQRHPGTPGRRPADFL